MDLAFWSQTLNYVCDFCLSPIVDWSYPTQDHRLPARLDDRFTAYQQSFGAWAVCDKCHQLIKQRDQSGLLERSLHMYYVRHPELKKRLKSANALRLLKPIHEGFWANRQGKAYRFG